MLPTHNNLNNSQVEGERMARIPTQDPANQAIALSKQEPQMQLRMSCLF